MTGWLGANLLALVGVTADVVRLAWPPGELVRLRNAMLIEPAREEDFHWSPDNVPRDFHLESLPPDPAFVAIVEAVDVVGRGDWEKALRIAAHLAEHAQDKGALQDDLLASYQGIRNGHGYCADFVKVFLALAHAAGLFARQWAFSFDGFGGHGHTFVEIYDRQRSRWVFLDPHNNFHVVDEGSGEPLSALEFRDRLRGQGSAMRMKRNGPGRMGYIHEHKAVDYFRRGAAQWYLWWGNAVVSYYRHPLVRVAGRISRVLAHLVANIVGLQPRIRIYPAEESGAAAERMFALRRHLRFSVVLGLGLTVSLVAQLMHGDGA